MRKTMFAYLMIAFGLVFMISLPLSAVDFSGSANFYFTNNYFWRITPLNVEDPHIQYDFSSSVTAGKLGIGFTPWISYNLSEKEANEIDYTLDFSYPINDSISTNIGAIYYDVTGAVETVELYLSLGYSGEVAKILDISSGMKFYYDIKEIKKGYLEPSISLSTPKIPYISISSILGVDFGQFALADENGKLVSDTKMTTLQIGLSGSYEINKAVTINPSFTYVIGLHNSIDNTSYAGLKFSFAY